MGEDVAVAEAETDAISPRTTLTIDGGLPNGYGLRHPVSVVVREDGSEEVADAPPSTSTPSGATSTRR